VQDGRERQVSSVVEASSVLVVVASSVQDSVVHAPIDHDVNPVVNRTDSDKLALECACVESTSNATWSLRRLRNANANAKLPEISVVFLSIFSKH